MSVQVAAVTICLLLTAGQDSADQKERKALEGAWVCVSSEVNGVKRGKEESRPQTFTFDGEQLTQADAGTGEVLRGTYKLDLSGKPKELATTVRVGGKGVTIRYVYQRDGETLTLCCHLLPGQGLPREVTGAEGSKQALLVFRKSKP
jgi:uncharacterized protein (TIGR03067 family)